MRHFLCSKNAFALLTMVLLVVACGGPSSPTDSPAPAPSVEVAAFPDSLVTTEWLSEHLDDPDVVLLDCTVSVQQGADGMVIESGRAGYEAGHIPTAGFADLMGKLADADSPYEYAVPSPEEFAAVMGALGVGDDTRVVLYDSSMSVWAARVWWMLRWVGFDRAAVLDGGLAAWQAEGRLLSGDPADEPARVLTPAPRPELIADRDEVFAAIGDESVRLIDVLPEAHYRGEMVMYARPGHISTAENVPIMGLLDEAGRFKSKDELAALFGGDEGARAITYCGGGIAASSTALVMTRLGYTDVAVYIGSLQEWTEDPANPMKVSTP
jgi:thiosulfate/3-mercaptopyruvate sulfurtransferase